MASYPHDELLAALAHEARRDADQVVASLSEVFSVLDRLYPAVALGDRWRDVLPRAFYLRLAAALRILELERRGAVIPAMQLPTGAEVFAGALQSVFDYSVEIPPQLRQVLFVFRRFFGWRAAVEMGASIVVDDIDEAELADQIANSLWDNRHTFGER